MNTNPETTESPVLLPKAFLKAASTDDTRYVITGVYYDAEGKVLVAINGRVLSTHPAYFPGVKSFNMHPDTFKKAGKNIPKTPYELTAVDGKIFVKGSANTVEAESMEGNFPNYCQVIPTNPTRIRICLNPKFLMDLAQAMDCDNSIQLETDEEANVFVVTNPQKEGPSSILMAHRCNDQLGILPEPYKAPSAEEIAALAQPSSYAPEPEPEETPDEPTEHGPEIEAPATPTEAKPVPTETPKPRKTEIPDAPVLTRNLKKNGIELQFPEKPSEEIRTDLKAHDFRYSARQAIWYARYREDRLVFAQQLAESTRETVAA